jgi:hypothetical protein
MAPPERDTSKNSDSDGLNTDLNGMPLAANQSVSSSSSENTDDTDVDDGQPVHYYRDGQIAYQQLGVTVADAQDDDEFDDFQVLAESRKSKSTKRNQVIRWLFGGPRRRGIQQSCDNETFLPRIQKSQKSEKSGNSSHTKHKNLNYIPYFLNLWTKVLMVLGLVWVGIFHSAQFLFLFFLIFKILLKK